MKGRETGWDPIRVILEEQVNLDRLRDIEYGERLSDRCRDLHGRISRNIEPYMAEVYDLGDRAVMETPMFDYKFDKFSEPSKLCLGFVSYRDGGGKKFYLRMDGVANHILTLTDNYLEVTGGQIGMMPEVNYFEIICSNWEKEEKKKAEAALVVVNETSTADIDTPVVSGVE